MTAQIISSLILLLLGVASFIPSMMSIMLFDTPGSEKKLAAKLLFLSIFSFPVVCLSAVAAIWIDFFFFNKQIIWVGGPLINLLGVAMGLIMAKMNK